MLFISLLKGLFILKIFIFLSWLFCYVEKRLDKKELSSFSKFMTSHSRNKLQYSYCPISQRVKVIKFGQLKEYSRNIFLEKSYTKCDGETISRPSSKKSKLAIYGSIGESTTTLFVNEHSTI